MAGIQLAAVVEEANMPLQQVAHGGQPFKSGFHGCQLLRMLSRHNQRLLELLRLLIVVVAKQFCRDVNAQPPQSDQGLRDCFAPLDVMVDIVRLEQ